MPIPEEMRNRHTVRKYIERPLPESVVALLAERVRQHNDAHATNIRLVTEDSSCFGPLTRLVLAKGVRNYLVMAGDDTPEANEQLGWCGADLMLYAQELGLNSWWVSGTFSRRGAARAAGVSGKVVGVIAVGYGATQGTPHRSKAASEVSSYEGEAPAWFVEGVKATLLAPTAMNKQAFHIKGRGDEVSLNYDKGACSDIDHGLVRYHFEIGAGRENFVWEHR